MELKHSRIHLVSFLPACFVIFVCILSLRSSCEAIQITSFYVPRFVISGKNVTLRVTYDMSLELLYSIKWYRDDLEFYRYVPSNKETSKTFSRSGIRVNENLSNETHIVLQELDIDSSGEYRCEISGEGPFFPTANKRALLQVVDIPKEGPLIEGVFPRYHIGDILDVNCSSLRSSPVAALKWYINGEMADSKYLLRYPTYVSEDGLKSSKLRLTFKLKPKHFGARHRSSSNSPRTNLKIKCAASIDTIYWRSNEESVQGLKSSLQMAPSSRRHDQFTRSKGGRSSRDQRDGLGKYGLIGSRSSQVSPYALLIISMMICLVLPFFRVDPPFMF